MIKHSLILSEAKQCILLQLLPFLDINSVECKAFEGLATLGEKPSNPVEDRGEKLWI